MKQPQKECGDWAKARRIPFPPMPSPVMFRSIPPLSPGCGKSHRNGVRPIAQQHPRPRIPTRVRVGTPPEWCKSHFKLPERNQYQKMRKRNCDRAWHLVGVSPGLEHLAGMLGREKGLGLCLFSLPMGTQHPSALGVQLRGSSPPCTPHGSWHWKTAQERGLCDFLNFNSPSYLVAV